MIMSDLFYINIYIIISNTLQETLFLLIILFSSYLLSNMK